jgi:uncharacterized protein
MNSQQEHSTKVIIFGATGHVGHSLVHAGMAAGHDVSIFVRDPLKAERLFDPATRRKLNVFVGDILDETAVAGAIEGHAAVVYAAGHNQDRALHEALCRSVVTAAKKTLIGARRVWVYGGLPGLDVPHTKTMGTDLPFMPALFKAHRPNYEVLRDNDLDWTFICPGPMYFAGRPGFAGNLAVSIEVMPYQIGACSGLLPKVFHPFIMYLRLKELVTAFEDVAALVMSNLQPNGPYSRKRIGIRTKSGLAAVDRNKRRVSVTT